MNIAFNKNRKKFRTIPKEQIYDAILEYMLKIPKLKNNLITGADSYNLSLEEYNSIMQNIQNQIYASKHKIKEPKKLKKEINKLKFKKNELKIERIIHDRKDKKSEKKMQSQDEKLFELVDEQNSLLKSKKKMIK